MEKQRKRAPLRMREWQLTVGTHPASQLLSSSSLSPRVRGFEPSGPSGAHEIISLERRGFLETSPPQADPFGVIADLPDIGTRKPRGEIDQVRQSRFDSGGLCHR